MGTINVFHRLEYGSALGSKHIGNLSRPFTITTTVETPYDQTYTLTTGATAVKVFDETEDLDGAVLVYMEWSDGPVEISWGTNTAEADADTSSFVSNDAVGGFMYLWGSGHNSHEDEAVSDRNSIDGGGSDVGIGQIWVVQTSGASIKFRVAAFK